jgi:hypothetical protein
LKRKLWLFVVVFGLILPALSACGKKRPPFLSKDTPLKVEQLKGAWKKGVVVLNGDIVPPRDQKKGLSDIAGCKVYYVWYAFDNPPCEGCPIHYPDHLDINEAVVSREGFSCQVPGLEKGGIYYFVVRLIGRKGGMGPASNRARVVIEK